MSGMSDDTILWLALIAYIIVAEVRLSRAREKCTALESKLGKVESKLGKVRRNLIRAKSEGVSQLLVGEHPWSLL